MPQARLPDINTAFIVYRREVINSLKNRNYDNCFGALYALNGLLPEEYRIQISTKTYTELTELDIKVKCPKCEAETDYKKIRVFELLILGVEGMIVGRTKDKVWTCLACGQDSKIIRTVMVQPTLKEPYFVKTVPKAPLRQDGLHDKTTYHRKISQWVWTFLDELEAQMAQFRDDNWHKGGEEYEDYGIDDFEGGEESD